ncbi:hypothetical protein D3C71_1524470 [compost metagenome]
MHQRARQLQVGEAVARGAGDRQHGAQLLEVAGAGGVPAAVVVVELDLLQHLLQLVAALHVQAHGLAGLRARGRAVAAVAHAQAEGARVGRQHIARGVDADFLDRGGGVFVERLGQEDPPDHRVAVGVAVVGPLDQQQREVEDLGALVRGLARHGQHHDAAAGKRRPDLACGQPLVERLLRIELGVHALGQPAFAGGVAQAGGRGQAQQDQCMTQEEEGAHGG